MTTTSRSYGFGNANARRRSIVGPDGTTYYRDAPPAETTQLRIWLVMNALRLLMLVFTGYLIAHSHSLVSWAVELGAAAIASRLIDKATLEYQRRH